MGFEIIDGYAGKAHITQDQIGDCNAGTYGSENYVLPVGRKLAYEIITNNKIRVYDGSFLIQGRRCHLQSNTYVDFVVENGSQGEKRYDILAAKYVKDAVTKVETIESVTYKGVPSSGTPDDPSIDSGDIRAGESPIAFPLYRVVIDGINIASVEPLFETLVKMSDIKGFLSSYAEIMACTKSGFLPDVLSVKDGFEQLDANLKKISDTEDIGFLNCYKNRSHHFGISYETINNTSFAKVIIDGADFYIANFKRDVGTSGHAAKLVYMSLDISTSPWRLKLVLDVDGATYTKYLTVDS